MSLDPWTFAFYLEPLSFALINMPSLNLKIIDPNEDNSWDDLILSDDNCSFFHTSAWCKTLCESYNYKPKYFTAFNKGKISAAIPIIEVNSLLTGKRGVSLPFTDYCEPIVDESIPFRDVFDYIITYGKKEAWKYIELRGGESFLPDVTPSTRFFGHILDLSQDEGRTFSSFRNSTKRNIKKANKEGVNVRLSKSLKSVKEFYRLNCLTRRQHGLPSQPFKFFKKVYDHIIAKNMGFVTLAFYGEIPIAAAVYLHAGNKVLYKYGASDITYQNLRANNLIMWEAIRWSCINGYKSFCFGRTEMENNGLRQFKSGWGTKENIIKYYKYDLQKNTFVKGTSSIKPIYNKTLKKLPLPVLKIMGTLLYKHMG
ncbi:MAG TPA: peptidoglycan bridge formation glycyltransferase FemA/FemB family protein [Thermoplasmata archaeon]|nr:peptidoglycan bridge formation glycyltransferase FemA/FemB family protein [Thermoplasmata archaeon]